MTEEQIARVKAITNANRQISEIYALLDELGIQYKRTGCSRCRRDLLAILREEAGLIRSAADESAFDAGRYDYRYLPSRSQSWHGWLINQDTPVEVVEEFIKQFPRGYYEKVAVEQHIEEITEEENTYSND